MAVLKTYVVKNDKEQYLAPFPKSAFLYNADPLLAQSFTSRKLADDAARTYQGRVQTRRIEEQPTHSMVEVRDILSGTTWKTDDVGYIWMHSANVIRSGYEEYSSIARHMASTPMSDEHLPWARMETTGLGEPWAPVEIVTK